MSFLIRDDRATFSQDTRIEGFQSKPTPPGMGGPAVKIPRVEHVNVQGLGATSASETVWIAADSYQVIGVDAIFGTASSAGTLNVEVASDGTAVGSGTAVLSSTISLAGTAATRVAGTLATNVDSLQVASGQHVNILLAGTLTSLANCCVTIHLVRT